MNQKICVTCGMAAIDLDIDKEGKHQVTKWKNRLDLCFKCYANMTLMYYDEEEFNKGKSMCVTGTGN